MVLEKCKILVNLSGSPDNVNLVRSDGVEKDVAKSSFSPLCNS